MKLDVVIPTLNRRDKLQVAINSIIRTAKNGNVKLSVFFSIPEEIKYWEPFFSGIENISLRYVDNYQVPLFWNTYLHEMQADALCYLNDDIELLNDTLDIILWEFPRRFPDYDGVMGLNQVNILDQNKVDAAFGVIGKKFAERFPYKQVWCPDYYRFYADSELQKFATELNRFYYCSDAKLFHYHPSLNPKWEDETHTIVRRWLSKDRKIYRARQEAGLLWGKSYRLINQE